MTLSISGEIEIERLALEYNVYITGRSSAFIAFLEITASNQKWTDLLKDIKSVFFFFTNPIFVKIVWLEHYSVYAGGFCCWFLARFQTTPLCKDDPCSRSLLPSFWVLPWKLYSGNYLPESRAVQWNVTILYGFGETAKWAKFKHFKVFAGVHVVGVYEVTCVWYYSLVEYCRCWSKVWAVRRNGSVHSPDSLNLWVTSSPWLSLVRLCTRTSDSPPPHHRVFHSSI